MGEDGRYAVNSIGDYDTDNIESEEDFSTVLADFHDISLSSSDWTVETLVGQIQKGNIDLSPSFQRREVWGLKEKSAFIESLVLAIPVPQIVLANKLGERGKYIVLDGKQRLLSILGFYEGSFSLKDPALLQELKGFSYQDLSDDYRDALDNATMRTVRLGGWKKDSVLYTIFNRLNNGSVPLNTQELRSALLPGPFTEFASEFTTNNLSFAALFNSSAEKADFRMRDMEMLTRFCGVMHNPRLYAGNLKLFLDETTVWLNEMDSDMRYRSFAEEAVASIDFYKDVYKEISNSIGGGAIPVFSLLQQGKKQRFNRAVFDALCYPLQDPSVRDASRVKLTEVAEALSNLLRQDDFIGACTLSTKTRLSLVTRVGLWAHSLSRTINRPVNTLAMNEDRSVVQQYTVS